MYKGIVLLSENLLQVFYGLKTFYRSYMDINGSWLWKTFSKSIYFIEYILQFFRSGETFYCVQKSFYRSSMAISFFGVIL